MAAPHSFADLVTATARQKLDAARARHKPSKTAEKPREAILDGLHIVDDALAKDGYAFSSSGLRFSRKHEDLAFQISVQSDRNNVAGQRAAVWVHAYVYSQTLTAWRKQHCSEWIRPNAPFALPFFVTQLGYLCHPAGWMEWDFADLEQRRLVANDLISCIQKGAFPAFSAIATGPEGAAKFTHNESFSPEGLLEYILAVGQPALAQQTLNDYLDARPELRMQFKQLYQQFSKGGLPLYRTASAHDLAAFAVASGYPWSASVSTRS